jgi:predicted aspartyl protease
MTGEVDESGTPILRLSIAGREWIATIDTGFNGDLELPEELSHHFSTKYAGESSTTLAGGKVIEEDLYGITFPFDGRMVEVEVAFARTEGILIGTRLLREHRLEVNFVSRTVSLERVAVE